MSLSFACSTQSDVLFEGARAGVMIRSKMKISSCSLFRMAVVQRLPAEDC